MHDWYETVKINYGISPEGRKDFDELPEYLKEDITVHFATRYDDVAKLCFE